MKKSLILILAAFVLVSCSLPFTISISPNTPAAPTAAATAEVLVVTATSQPEVPNVTLAPQFVGVAKNLGGVSFTLPDCLGFDAAGVILPEENPGADMPYYAYQPETRKITFSGYPLSGKFWDPKVEVYPVAAFKALVPPAVDTINEMQTLLANPPADIQGGIPLLPYLGAAQVFHAQVSFLNFQNGKGVGFLTEYSQYFDTVNNQDMFYTFQGLTNDGKYWVSMMLPVNALYLQPSPDDATIPADGIAAPDINSNQLDVVFKTYYADMVTKLNNTPVDAFTPSLACITQFVQSLSIAD